jgi:hypothetical protein
MELTMKNLQLDPIQSTTLTPSLKSQSYWDEHVINDIAQGNWSKTNINSRINLVEWQDYLVNLPRDPYVDTRWKRMSWLYLNESGCLNTLNACPMAQGGAYNDADTMADKLRYYPELEKSFLLRPDVQAFVKAWAELWGIKTNEPILMQINGVKGDHSLDPLQGQGIHQDGSQFLSILVLNRNNVIGGSNILYQDKSNQHPITDTILSPGEIMHIRDSEVFHDVSPVRPLNTKVPFERFIIIINSRFNDAFQNRILRQHFPDVVLNQG